MPSYLTSIVLQWSADPLSDTTPTWTTISNDEIRDIEWWAGIDREGNDPEPGGMVVTLKNKLRKWEPLYGSNTIDTQQRFRLTVNGTQEGVWYSESFSIDYPDGQDFSWVTIGCGDGFTVLAQDDLPGMDPPEADAYDDVVGFDEPWGFWTLGDPPGTRAAANVIRRFRGKGKRRRKIRIRRGENRITRSEAGAVSGPAGVYRGTPALGQPSLVVGDVETSCMFNGTTQRVHIPLEEVDEFSSMEALALEVWVKWDTAQTAPGSQLLAGPENSSDLSTFSLLLTSTPRVQFIVRDSAGVSSQVESGTLVQGTTYHIVGVYTGISLLIYVDGVLAGTTGFAPSTLQAGATGEVVSICRDETNAAGGTPPNSVTVQKAAIYPRSLTAARVLAHYQAGAQRGFSQQTAGERISAIATSALWSEASIQTAGWDVVPVFQIGQTRLEEISESAHAEGPRTLFFFNGNGDPVYLGFNWQASSTDYYEIQATFTDDGTGEPYNDIRLEYDFETFNEVVASHESGEEVTDLDATEQAKRGRRVNTEYTDVLLVEHMDVEGLAAGVLELYRTPAKRPVSLTIDGHHSLSQILNLDIGHLVRVKKSGETGDPTDRLANIIGKRKMIDTSKHLTCTYTLARGWPADDGEWLLGIDGYSELGETTVLA